MPVYYPDPVLAPAPHRRTSGKAVTALVLGIIGIVIFGLTILALAAG